MKELLHQIQSHTGAICQLKLQTNLQQRTEFIGDSEMQCKRSDLLRGLYLTIVSKLKAQSFCLLKTYDVFKRGLIIKLLSCPNHQKQIKKIIIQNEFRKDRHFSFCYVAQIQVIHNLLQIICKISNFLASNYLQKCFHCLACSALSRKLWSML